MARPADPTARKALVEAAKVEFVRHGIARARIEDITQAVGLSKGAFYLHFESKEALFAELVEGLMRRVEGGLAARRSEQQALFKKRTARSQAWLDEVRAADERHDRQLLEILWESRQVIDVLLRGAQGTPFEGVMWAMCDQEMERIQAEVEQMKELGLCRQDVAAPLIGMMVMGTYVMVARKMSTLQEKPDLDYWVSGLANLLSEGTATFPRQARAAAPLKARRAPGRVAARQAKSKSKRVKP